MCSLCHSCAFLSHWTQLTLPEKTKQVSCSPITSRKPSPPWLLSGHLPHVKHGLLEIRPQELRKPSKHVSPKRKLVRSVSVLSCGTVCHEDSPSPSACVGECTHAWEGIGPLPPSHFAMMSLADIVAIAGFLSQPPHCKSCSLTGGSLSAFASFNANRLTAKYIPMSAVSHSEGENMQR